MSETKQQTNKRTLLPQPNRGLAGLRAATGLSQTELATKAGIPSGRIGDWEQGSRSLKGVRLGTAKRLADALGVGLDELWAQCVN